MKKLTALAWKEWRESQAYLWIGLGLFLGLPVVGGLEGMMLYHRRFEIESSAAVAVFGPVLAVVTAVGATSRDLRGRLEDFWRSRPVGLLPWMGIKFLVGFVIVLIACQLPVAIELRIDHEKAGWPVLLWCPFLLAVAYSLGFLAGCGVRQTATAGVAALTAVLLVYCLPVVIPPLQVFGLSKLPTESIAEIWSADEKKAALLFTLGMVVLAAAVLVTTWMVLRRDWRMPSGRKMVYGLIAVALLTVTGSAAFQLGTNLPIQQQIELPGNEWIRQLNMHGRKGVVLTTVDWTEKYAGQQRIRTVNVVGDDMVIGPPLPIQLEEWRNLINNWPTELAPGISARLDALPNATAKDSTDEQLIVFDNLTGQTLNRITVLTRPTMAPAGPAADAAACQVWNNHLYITGNKRLIVYDLADPTSPRKVSDKPFQPPLRTPWDPGNPLLLIDLIDLPGVPAAARMKMTVGTRLGDDGLLLLPDRSNARDILYVYKGPEQITDKVASFRLIGHYEPSLLDEVGGVSNDSWGEARAFNLLYTSGYGGGEVINPQTTVFQLDPIKVVGHFAAPEARLQCLLPDQRAVVAGAHKIYVIGTPKK